MADAHDHDPLPIVLEECSEMTGEIWNLIKRHFTIVPDDTHCIHGDLTLADLERINAAINEP